MMLRKKLDHPVTIGVTDRIRRIHDHRACVLSLGEAIKHRPALAHREYICAAAVKRGIGLDKLNAEAEKNRKALEAQLHAKLAEAEKSIAATRTQAMSNVRAIAIDAAGAIVARLTGGAPSESAVSGAVDAVLKR